MVNDEVTTAREAEAALVVSYSAAGRRAAFAALLALDGRLGRLASVAREPMLAQMRLTWWYEALRRLDTAPPPAEPLLAEIAATLPCGITGARLATLADGWEVLLAPPFDRAALLRFASGRGAALFTIAADLLGGRYEALAEAGEGWALADAARRLDGDAAALAAVLAKERLAAAGGERWPRALRPLGALTLLARADLAGVAPGAPRRVARLAWHRLTGR